MAYLSFPLEEMKLKILGSPLPSRVDDVEMEMDTLGPPKPANAAVMQRKKSRVRASWVGRTSKDGIGIGTHSADFLGK